MHMHTTPAEISSSVHLGILTHETYQHNRNLKFNFKLSTKVVSADIRDNGVTLNLEPAAGGAQEQLEADVALVSVGRRPRTEDLNLEKIGVQVSSRCFLFVLRFWRHFVSLLFFRVAFSMLALTLESLGCYQCLQLQSDASDQVALQSRFLVFCG
jgi:hypothetical protein